MLYHLEHHWTLCKRGLYFWSYCFFKTKQRGVPLFPTVFLQKKYCETRVEDYRSWISSIFCENSRDCCEKNFTRLTYFNFVKVCVTFLLPPGIRGLNLKSIVLTKTVFINSSNDCLSLSLTAAAKFLEKKYLQSSKYLLELQAS